MDALWEQIPREERLRAFAKALDHLMKSTGLDHNIALARLIGKSSQTVINWRNARGFPDDPDAIFTAEKVLGAQPGALSLHLGFLPAFDGDWPAPDVEAAILADDRLDSDRKLHLLSGYRIAIGRFPVAEG